MEKTIEPTRGLLIGHCTAKMSPGQCPSIRLAGDSIDCRRGREENRNRHLGLKTWLSSEPEIEVQSPGQNQLGVTEDKVQGNRLPTCNLWGYFDTKKSMVGKS